MKYFIDAEQRLFAFEDADTEAFINQYAKPDWVFISNPPVETPKPSYDPIAQVVIRDGCEFVDGQWRYKWRVDQLSPEQVSINRADAATAEREAAKVRRAAAVAAITVTTAAGNTFDGDEVSQGRMARAIVTLQATSTPETLWILHDNSVTQVTLGELYEALALAGAEQTRLWPLT